jgi:hypothetical protein
MRLIAGAGTSGRTDGRSVGGTVALLLPLSTAGSCEGVLEFATAPSS